MVRRRQTRRNLTLRSILLRTVGFALLWLLAAEGNTSAWPLALVGIGAATAASFCLLPPQAVPRLSPAALTRFLVWFINQSLIGGIQVARLALQRRPALRPAQVELPLKLPPGWPRLLFTASLGLMPGTLGVRLQGDILLVHVLDHEHPLAAEAEKLAAHVAAIFGGRS